jgi:hypothetical protein
MCSVVKAYKLLGKAELTSKPEIETMQPDEFARTREREKGTKAKSSKSRCDKVDAVISKGVSGGGFDICETWVPMAPHRLGSRRSLPSAPDLPEAPPTCKWAQRLYPQPRRPWTTSSRFRKTYRA